MAGLLPHPRRAARPAPWPRALHRGALLLGAGSGLYWSSFVLGPQTLWTSAWGAVYVDLLLAWAGVLVQVAAWPSLWMGLRDLRSRWPREGSVVLAFRAFVLAVLLVLGSVLILPLQYHALASSEASLVVVVVTAFPFVAGTAVPVLALHGIVFGRVARYLDPRPRRVADVGAAILFAVAGATTAVLLEHPGPAALQAAWGAGTGALPGAAFAGYALISAGMTLHAAPASARREAAPAGGR